MASVEKKSYMDTLFDLLLEGKTSEISKIILSKAREEFIQGLGIWKKKCDQRNVSIDEGKINGFLYQIEDCLKTSQWNISGKVINTVRTEYKELEFYIILSNSIQDPKPMDNRNPQRTPCKVSNEDKLLESNPTAKDGDKLKDTTKLRAGVKCPAYPESHVAKSEVYDKNKLLVENKNNLKCTETVNGNVKGSSFPESNVIKRDEQSKLEDKCSHRDEQGPDPEDDVDQGRNITPDASLMPGQGTKPNNSIADKADCIENSEEAISRLSGDSNPSEISIEYEQLFKKEWWHVYSKLAPVIGQDCAVECLLKILEEAYRNSHQLAESQLKQMKAKVHEVVSGKEQQSSNTAVKEDLDLLKEFRRRNVFLTLPHLKESFLQQTQSQQKKLQTKVDETALKDLQVYAMKCLEVSWYACIQDRPMVLAFKCMPNTKGDLKNNYVSLKPGQQGKRIQYIVLPPLHLYKDGPIACKGVAELM